MGVFRKGSPYWEALIVLLRRMYSKENREHRSALGCNGLFKKTEKSSCSVVFLCTVLSPDQAELLVMEHNMTPVHRDLKTETRSEK